MSSTTMSEIITMKPTGGNNTKPLSATVKRLMDLEDKYSVGGFTPLPAYFVSGKGALLKVCRLANILMVKY